MVVGWLGLASGGRDGGGGGFAGAGSRVVLRYSIGGVGAEGSEVNAVAAQGQSCLVAWLVVSSLFHARKLPLQLSAFGRINFRSALQGAFRCRAQG